MPTTKESTAQYKEQLVSSEIEGSKTRQQQLIARCTNEIEYLQTQITKLEQQRQDAQDLLDELEVRFPKRQDAQDLLDELEVRDPRGTL